MELTTFTILVFLLFLPGIICKLLIKKLVYIEKRTSFFFIIYAFVLACISYFIYGILVYQFSAYSDPQQEFSPSFLIPLLEPDFIKSNTENLTTKLIAIFKDVLYVSLISVPVALILSGIINHKWFNSFAEYFKFSKRFGDEDVWSYVLNSPDSFEWVYVRDIKNNLVYYGWVSAFSETVKEAELLLTNVKVCAHDTGEIIYEVPALYLSHNRNDIILEFPDFKIKNLESDEYKQ